MEEKKRHFLVNSPFVGVFYRISAVLPWSPALSLIPGDQPGLLRIER
jgi:hypothetical protein